jgi:leucyl aminopeptidase
MNALLGVARGSAQPPRLIILEHHYSDDVKTVALVGKGVTFDTGGISIKPAASMHEMKYDMCGAAAVLCAFMTLAELRPAINVIAVVPAAENMTGDAAQRPGDIVRAYNGKTIEVHNTDAEGRLILADAMAYAVDKYKPAAMVDAATLTGACVVALGFYAAGLFTNNQELADSLIAAGNATGERLWQLPLWPDYEKLIEGTHADLCNIGPREGGAISAAAFLKEFVGDTPWAHLDIAGTAWGVKNIPYWSTDHATGFGVRLLTNWVLNQVEEG